MFYFNKFFIKAKKNSYIFWFQIVVSAPDKVKESVAAKRLFKKVNSLINKLEKELEGQEQKLKKVIEAKPEIPAIEKVEVEQLVHIDELMNVIRQVILLLLFFLPLLLKLFLKNNFFLYNRFKKFLMIPD